MRSWDDYRSFGKESREDMRAWRRAAAPAMTFKEIADEMGCSEMTVIKLYRQALKKMRGWWMYELQRGGVRGTNFPSFY